MLPDDIRRVMKDDERFITAFEKYDRTGDFPFDRVRIDLSLRRETVERLRAIAKKRGTSVSAFVDLVVGCLS